MAERIVMPKTTALSLAALLFAQALAPAQAQVPSDTEETFAQSFRRFLDEHPEIFAGPHRASTLEDVVDDLAPYLIGGAIATATIALIGAGVFLIRRARP